MTEKAPDQNTEQNVENKNKIEQRINRLYGEKKEAEELATNLQAKNEELRAQMLDLQEQVKEIKSTPAQPQEPPAGETLNAGVFDEAKIEKIVEQSVGKVLSTNQAIVQENERLRQAQVSSWNDAKKDVPGLSDENSDIYKTAQNIWENDPEFKKSPNGPYKAAMMAQGIIAGDGRPNTSVNAATQQQTINSNLSAGSIDSKIDKIDKEIESLKDAMHRPTGGNIGSTWGRFKDLQAQKGELIKLKEGK